MASTKKLTVTCTGISLLGDGRQQVTMQKAAGAATVKTAGGGMIVAQPDAVLTLAIDPAEGANYAVGRDYALAIT